MEIKSEFDSLWGSMAQSSDKKFQIDTTKFIDFFGNLLEFAIVGRETNKNVHITYFDMSSIKMKVTARTPFFVVKILTDDRHEINDIFLMIKNEIYQNALQDQINFIIVVGETGYFSILIKDSLLDLAILDEDSLRQIVFDQKPTRQLTRVCRQQIKVHKLSPYETVNPVVGRMFYGRKHELELLLNKNDSNFVITGCRKIGKTSLILNAFFKMKDEKTTYPIFLDCYPYKSILDFIDQVVRRLEIRELRRMRIDKFHDFLRRMKKKYKKPITFVLDEVDGLLLNDKMREWELFNIMSSAHNEGYCRFIITGYRVVFEEMRNLKSPLYRFLEAISIHNLDRKSAANLITQPIRDLGIIFSDSPKIVDEILKQTDKNPNLIQFICKKLVEIESRRSKNEISHEDITEVIQSSEYRHYITDTFILNTTKIEQLMVLGMCENENFTDEDIYKKLESMGIRLNLNELEKNCINLEMANIFYKNGGQFKYANPALPQILREDFNPGFMIEKLVEEINLNGREKNHPTAESIT